MNRPDQGTTEKSGMDLNDLNSKIFIVNRYFPLTSIYRWTQDISSVFGMKATVINLIFKAIGNETLCPGMCFYGKFRKLPYLNNLFRNIAFTNARKYIESLARDADNAIVHYTNQFSGVLNIPGVETIVSVHDSPYYTEGSSLVEKQYLIRLYNSLKKQRYIITNTNHLKNELIDFGFKGEITAVYSPYSSKFRSLSLEKNEIRVKLGLHLDKKLILSVSTDSPRKNLPMINRVVKELGDDFRLVRVGTPLGNSITFKGIDDDTLNELYNACDVLLFPSLYEGFGLPIVEAFASGLPVVTSDIPTIREVAGDAAVLCNPRDQESLKEGVRFAIEHSGELIRKGINSSRKFSFDYFKNAILSFYEGVINEQS